MIDVNVKGAIYAVRAGLPHLLRSDAADLVTIASEAAGADCPTRRSTARRSSRRSGLTAALDHELREQGVRCTNICPGGVATDFAMGRGRTPDMPQLGGMMKPQDVAEAVLFVVSRPRHASDPRGGLPAGHRDLLGLSRMDTLRWGILSTADIARKKVIPACARPRAARSWRSRPATGGRAERVAAELGIPRAHGSYEALLADPEVDAVYIPLPNHLHAEWTIAAAKAGKHVLCEKPLALTAADAQRMVDVADAAGVQLMEAFMYRLHPSWAGVRELVESGGSGGSGGPELVLVLQRRPDEHPQHPRGGRRGAVRHRLLLGEPVADAVRRRADPRPGGAACATRRRRRRADERDPRVRGGHRDIHLLDPGRGRPARPHLRHDGPHLDRHPVQHPARPADRGVSVTPAATRRWRRTVEVLTFETADPYAVEAERSPRRSWTASRAGAAGGRGREPAGHRADLPGGGPRASQR